MMTRRFSIAARATVGALGGLVLIGAGTAAFAQYPDAEGSSDVNVNVTIDETESAGALSLTVDGTESTLTENGSTDAFRQFTGVLPDVTVTDTRTDASEGAYWYVVGQAGAFEGTDGQSDITPDHLGWTPAVVTDGEGEVTPGDEVATSLDTDAAPNNVGLEGEELLQLSLDSATAQAANGSWTANADLTLKTPVDVEAGDYTSVLTLSLFEDEF